MNATDKHYAIDWAKDKSREMVREMIGRTILSYKNPKQLQVLCFPGIDAKEVTQVYDSLGIPRANVIGLERDKHVAAELERKQLGIRVVNQSLEDYIESQRGLEFDVVSLDYTQPVYEKELETVYSILLKQNRNACVLHVANSSKRDSQSIDLYKMGIGGVDLAINHKSEQGREAYYDQMGSAMSGFEVKLANKESKIEEKQYAFSKLLRSLFSGLGCPVGTKHVPLERVEKVVMFLAGQEYMHDVARYVQDATHEFQDTPLAIDPQRPLSSIPSAAATHLSTDLIRWLTEARAKELTCYTPGMGAEINLLAMTGVKDRSFFVNVADQSYAYVSESGCPMVGDIYFLQRPHYFIEAASKVLPKMNFPREFRVSDSSFYRSFVEASLKMLELHKQRIQYNGQKEHHERIFLGNAAKPVLSKQRFLEELESGLDMDDIKAKYRGWQKKPLAQWKAHHTMGTYRKSDELVETPEDEDLEKINKDEAIDLIRSGLPLDEILKNYPTSFTKGQLSAFKAHITMGTYAERSHEVVA